MLDPRCLLLLETIINYKAASSGLGSITRSSWPGVRVSKNEIWPKISTALGKSWPYQLINREIEE